MSKVIADALRWWVRAQPERIALDVDGEQVSYGDLGAWTDRVAHHLVAVQGVQPGDVVAVAGLNSVDWCIAALGASKAGAIVTPVNYRYTAREVDHLMADCSPAVVLADDHEMQKVTAVVEGGRDTKVLPMAVVGELRHADPVSFHAEMAPSDPAILAYTSGTTGDPKGLVYTHETVLAALFELLLKDPTPPEETNMLLALPLFSVGGIVHSLFHVVSRGAKVVVMRDFDPARALELLAEHRISHMNGVPVIYERIAAQPGFAERDLSHIKVAMVGGARVSDQLLQAFNAGGVALRHMYGMTEAGGCGTVPRPADALAHPELCGDGSIFTEVRTMRQDGGWCAPGEEGEIVMRGPAMMVGYWRRPEATAAAIRDGWLHSGDLGVIDDDGYLRYVDRLKDMIISGGFNVSPTEVENVLCAVPGVTEVAVIAVHDERWGETPAAIVYSEAGDVDDDALLDAARRELAVFKVPRYIVHSDAPLPRMASGKLAKRQLREEYADVPTRIAASIPS